MAAAAMAGLMNTEELSSILAQQLLQADDRLRRVILQSLLARRAGVDYPLLREVFLKTRDFHVKSMLIDLASFQYGEDWRPFYEVAFQDPDQQIRAAAFTSAPRHDPAMRLKVAQWLRRAVRTASAAELGEDSAADWREDIWAALCYLHAAYAVPWMESLMEGDLESYAGRMLRLAEAVEEAKARLLEESAVLGDP
jgi:hypothetical protein